MTSEPPPLDPRLNPYRPDLAAESLRGRVTAERFVQGQPLQVVRGVTDLRRAPAVDAPLDSQLLFGEEVLAFEEVGGWSWVQNRGDHYVGYVDSAALSAAIHAPTHVVKVPRSLVFSGADLKSPPLDSLSLTSPVTVVEEDGKYCRLTTDGWVYGRHLAELGETVDDYAETALSLLGVPYLWGGRSSLGLDCSALLQMALARAGIVALRDSSQQQDTLGEPLEWAGLEQTPPDRGDLLFMAGHCAIALDATRVVHANAYAMAVSVEETAALEARVIAESGRGITGRRRPR